MNKRTVILLVVLLFVFFFVVALFSCLKQKSSCATRKQPAVLIMPLAKEKIGKKTTWAEERKYSGNRGYFMHDGVYVYFGHYITERKEVPAER